MTNEFFFDIARKWIFLLSALLLVLLATPSSAQITDAISSSIASDFFRPTLNVQNPAGSIKGLNVDGGRTTITVLLASDDAAVWSVVTGIQLTRIRVPGAVSAGSNKMGSVIIAQSADGNVDAYAGDGSRIATAQLNGVPVGLIFSSAGVGYAASSAGVVRFDPNARKFSPIALPTAIPTAIGYGGQGSEIAVATQSGTIFRISESGAVIPAGTIMGPANLVSGCEGSGDLIAVTAAGVFTVNATGSKPYGSVSNALAIDRACRYIAQGSGNGEVTLHALDGSSQTLSPTIKLGFKESPVAGAFLDSNLSRAISAEKSGMLRIWDLTVARDVLQIYMTATGWAVIDQNGRFDASQEGMLDVGWLTKAQRVSLDQFSDKYFEPGLLSDYMTAQGELPNSRVSSISEQMTPPPKLEIRFLSNTSKAGEPTVVLVVADDQGGGIGPLHLYHNGKLVPAGAFVQQQDTTVNNRQHTGAAYRVMPTAGPNTFLATAQTTKGLNGSENQDVMGRSDTVTKNFEGPAAASTLYLLVAAVGNYEDTSLEKLNSVKDGQAIASWFQQQGSSHFTRVVPIILTDGQATLAGVKSSLGTLAASQPNDVIVVYLAGHGEILDNDWNFITVGGHLGRTDLTSSDLREALVAAPAQRVFLMIDSCHSGETTIAFNRFQSFQKRFMRDLGSTAGVTVLAAAQPNKDAYDADMLGHGVFTSAVLDGLNGAADVEPHDGTVTAHKLVRFTERDMRVLSDKIHLPEVQQPAAFALGADFLLR